MTTHDSIRILGINLDKSCCAQNANILILSDDVVQ